MSDLTVILPTLNEVGNVKLLYSKISVALSGVKFEVLFIDDDSTDGTLDAINDLIENHDNVKLIRRINRRGISSAFIEGASSCNSKYIAIMDADLQHDETLLKKMFNTIQSENLDVVVGSRFKKNASVPGLSKMRKKLSKVGNAICKIASGVELTDPLSGFFMVRKSVVEKILYNLSGIGFKILLDIFATCRNRGISLKIKEIPMIFKQRNSGKSKLDIMIILEFLMLIFDKLFGKFIPIRFVFFVLVGLSGIFVHATILVLFIKILKVQFIYAQTIATLVAMISNFFFNNIFTYRDKRLEGVSNITKGLASFCIACSIGALVNIIAADFLHSRGIHWLIAGVIGGLAGSVWNYAITACFTWEKERRSA